MPNKKGSKRNKVKKSILSDERVLKLYSNLHNQTALSSIQQFAKAFKQPLDLVALEDSLNLIPAYSRHRRVRKRVLRPSLITRQPGQYFCADLAVLENLKQYNKNYSYILVTQDCFSKLLSCIPLKKKTGESVAKAIRLSFKQLKAIPEHYLTDNGSEFIAKESKKVYKDLGVNHIISSTNNKSFQCEVGIKILKERLFKFQTLNNTRNYIDALDLIVKNLNDKVHSATGYAPSQVNAKNRDEIFSYMYRRLVSKPRPSPKLSPNDLVRISHKRVVFSKAYLPGYSEEIFRVKAIVPTWPIFTYRLTDLHNNDIQSTFTESELSLVKRHHDGSNSIQRDSSVQQTN